MQLKIALQKMRYDLDSSMSEQERGCLSNMMASTKNLAGPNLILGHVALLGDPEKVVLSEENRDALLRSDIAFDKNEEYSVYQRLFQSCFYKRVKRQDNSNVLLESGKVFQIQCFIVISNVCYAMGHYFKERRNARLVIDNFHIIY
ncbi:30S ribosomal protein S4 [Frankliniella fusca]|uniref:30S ribosomal protein S4 n=1 Tax=Frankliniella fusca TaxID=407009 RepID=A0AAE1GUU9_9NEOP|nr:30S ribosomal protein S4 [Frankliniella fusca]